MESSPEVWRYRTANGLLFPAQVLPAPIALRSQRNGLPSCTRIGHTSGKRSLEQRISCSRRAALRCSAGHQWSGYPWRTTALWSSTLPMTSSHLLNMALNCWTVLNNVGLKAITLASLTPTHTHTHPPLPAPEAFLAREQGLGWGCDRRAECCSARRAFVSAWRALSVPHTLLSDR